MPDNNYYTDQDVIFYNTKLPAGGSINYTVTLIDDKGLSSEAVIYSKPPTIGGTIEATINLVSGTVLHGSKYYTKNNTVTLNLSVRIHASGVAGYKIKNNNAELDANSGIWETWDGKNSTTSPDHVLTQLADGNVNKIYVWVKDNVGNISSMITVSVTIAKDLPEIASVTIGEQLVSDGEVNLNLATIPNGGNYITTTIRYSSVSNNTSCELILHLTIYSFW